MNQAATDVVSNNVNLWPEIEGRLRPPVQVRGSRRRGVFKMMIAALIVTILGVVFLMLNGAMSTKNGDASGLHVASLQDMTPTPTLTDTPAADNADLCAEYPLFCVPFGENFSSTPNLAFFEASTNPRATAMLYNATGVVRGVSPEGMPFIGNPAAPTRLEVVMSLNCEHCLDFWQNDLKRIIEDYVLTGQAIVQLRLVNLLPLYNMPGLEYDVVVQLAYCAGEQGLFWEMVDEIVTKRASIEWVDDNAEPLALDIFNASMARFGLNAGEATFQNCLAGDYVRVIQANDRVLNQRSIEGVPTVQFLTADGRWFPLEDRSYGNLVTLIERVPTFASAAMDTVIIDNWTAANSYYVVEGELTEDNRQAVYVLSPDETLMNVLAERDNWVLLTVQGGETIPQITVKTALRAGNARASARYTSSDGSVLFNWRNLKDAADPADERVHIVELTGVGEYTLSVFPLPTPVDIAQREQAIMLVPSGSMPVTFDVPETELVRLSIRVDESELSMEDALSSIYIPQPRVAVLAPHGETLGVFDPNRTEYFELTFIPPVEGEQSLVLHPMETSMTNGFDGIPLLVSLEPVSAAEQP